MHISTDHHRATTYNVMGFIEGSLEPGKACFNLINIRFSPLVLFVSFVKLCDQSMRVDEFTFWITGMFVLVFVLQFIDNIIVQSVLDGLV